MQFCTFTFRPHARRILLACILLAGCACVFSGCVGTGGSEDPNDVQKSSWLAPAPPAAKSPANPSVSCVPAKPIPTL